MENQQLTQTVKYGRRSVIVWGCMAANGISNLCFIDGIITACMYIDILRLNLKSIAQKIWFRNVICISTGQLPKHSVNLT